MSDLVSHVLINLQFLLKAIGNGLVFGALPFVVVFLFLLPLQFWGPRGLRSEFAKIVAFAFIGTFLGMFTGASREPITAAMLPASITLISGVTVFFFERKQAQRPDLKLAVLAPMLCALVLGAAFGAHQASYLRVLSLMREQAAARQAEIDKADHTEIKVVLDRARLCREVFAGDAEMKSACAGLLKK